MSDKILARIATSSNLSQICQVATNSDYFQIACDELEHGLTSLRLVFSISRLLLSLTRGLRTTQRGGTIVLPTAKNSFGEARARALSRVDAVISDKLNLFFELAEYDWTPPGRESQPSMYLYELVQWLTTVVDGLDVKEEHKDDAYRGAFRSVSEWLMVGYFLFGLAVG